LSLVIAGIQGCGAGFLLESLVPVARRSS